MHRIREEFEEKADREMNELLAGLEAQRAEEEEVAAEHNLDTVQEEMSIEQ